MPAEFDPYHKWLGIPPADQPPDHYRLLGIARFESDPDVIEAAADRQMAHIRSYQSGARAAVSQKLLNEIAGAKTCLLSAEQRSAYDRKLKNTAASKKGTPTAVQPARQTKEERPLRKAKPIETTSAEKPSPAPIVNAPESQFRHRKSSKRGSLPVVWIVGAGAAIATGVGLLFAAGVGPFAADIPNPSGEIALENEGNRREEPLRLGPSSTELPAANPADSVSGATQGDVASPPSKIEPPIEPTEPAEVIASTEQDPDEPPAEEPVPEPTPLEEPPPEPAPPAPEPVTEVEQPQRPRAGKPLPPDTAEEEAALAKIRSAFEQEYANATTSEQKIVLGNMLLKTGADTNDDLTIKYALLRIARDIFVGEG